MKDKTKKAKTYSSPLLKKLMNNRDKIETNRTRNRMILAAQIDDLLKVKGWNKNQLAEKLNRKPSEIIEWLSGTHDFSLDVLKELEKVFEKKLLP